MTFKQIQSMNAAPERRCRWMNECCICNQKIESGQLYKDRGYGKRAHVECLHRETMKFLEEKATVLGEPNA